MTTLEVISIVCMRVCVCVCVCVCVRVFSVSCVCVCVQGVCVGKRNHSVRRGAKWMGRGNSITMTA